MAWFTLLSYTPPAGSGTGAKGAVGAGWTDVGTGWQAADYTAGGTTGRVLQITDSTNGTPWAGLQLVRKASSEAAQNAKVSLRWTTSAGGRAASPFIYLRYVPNTTDAQPNGWGVQPGQAFPISSGNLGAAVTQGSAPAFAANAWFDTTVTISTSSGNVSITEQTWSVTNPFSDAFASGTSITNNSFPTQTAFANSIGGVGLFAFKPGVLSVQQFSSFSDTAATALTVSPSSASAAAGAATAFTVGVGGAQNGGSVSLSDGGAGGVFSPTSVTLAPGAGASASFTYTPSTAAGGSTVVLTASSSALTGAAISGTASVAVSAAPASRLTLSPASQTVNAGASSAAITVTPDGALGGTTAVNLNDGGASGSFSPTTLTLSPGSSSAAFTYTPGASASGSITLTASATGLASGTASINAVAPATTVLANDARVVWSPRSWVVLSGGAARTNRPGAYMRLAVSGVSSFAVNFAAGTNTGATVMVRIDDGVMGQPVSAKSNAALSIALPDTGPHVVTLQVNTLPQSSGRWDGSNAVIISSFAFGTGASVTAPARGARNVQIYGDSIIEGTQAVDGADGFRASWAFVLGEALRRSGWEYGVHCAASSGLAWTTPAASGGQPAAWTGGNDAASAWNKLDGSGAAGAALTSGTPGAASERFVQQPDLILECWGTNDGINNLADAAVTASALGLLQRLRVAAPAAVILKVLPIGGYKRAALGAAVAQANDRRTLLVDLAVDQKMVAAGYCGNILTGTAGAQNVHPWSLASAHVAAFALAAILAAYVPLVTARAFGSAS